MSIERGTALVRKWQPRFGLSDCRIHCLTLPDNKESLAESWFDPEEEWGIIWLPADDSMSPELLELTVLHELAHGLLWYAEPEHTRTAATERFCNRIARLVRGDFTSLDYGEQQALLEPEKFFDGNDKARLRRRKWLPIVVDGLPDDEREVINALYYEDVSLRDVAERLGVDVHTVFRIRERALERMSTYFTALETKFDE